MLLGGAPLRPLFAPPFFSFSFRERKEPLRPVKKRKRTFEVGSANCAAIASEEACSIAFPPGRRKLHIRSLLLPSQIVTVSLGHNLVSMDFAAPHAIWMMAVRRCFTDTHHPVGADALIGPLSRSCIAPCRGGRPCPPANVGLAGQLRRKAMRRAQRPFGW